MALVVSRGLGPQASSLDIVMRPCEPPSVQPVFNPHFPFPWPLYLVFSYLSFCFWPSFPLGLLSMKHPFPQLQTVWWFFHKQVRNKETPFPSTSETPKDGWEEGWVNKTIGSWDYILKLSCCKRKAVSTKPLPRCTLVFNNDSPFGKWCFRARLW